MWQWPLPELLPPEGEHEGEGCDVPPGRVWTQDQYLGQAQADSET